MQIRNITDHHLFQLIRDTHKHTRRIRRLLYAWGVNEPSRKQRAIVATRYGKLVGFVRYDPDYHTVWMAGTWVARAERRNGLATKLWERMLRKHKNKGIAVTVSSPKGAAFVKKLQKLYPTVEFSVSRGY